MDTKQPEALRLANMLEKPGYGWHSTPAECAAELQRLQSENDTLRAGYDAARLEIESLQAQAQQCGAGAGCCAQAARIEELQGQLEAVGAGGVGALMAAPNGWQLVPVEPTKEMKAAAVKFANGNAVYKNVSAGVLEVEEGIYGEAYEAMLAAAPQPPAQAQDARKPLTDAQFGEVVSDAHVAFCLYKFATFERALVHFTELAHGITAAKNGGQHGAE